MFAAWPIPPYFSAYGPSPLQQSCNHAARRRVYVDEPSRLVVQRGAGAVAPPLVRKGFESAGIVEAIGARAGRGSLHDDALKFCFTLGHRQRL